MEKLIPKLRFPEFKEDWKLSDYRNLVKLNQGLQISIDKRYTEYRDGLHFYITNEFLKKDSNKKFYIENPPLSCICTEDDILMTRTGNTGKVVTNVKGAFHNNFFRINYDKKNTYKNFLFYELTREKTQNKIISLAGTSTIPDLNHTDFYSLKINIPTLQEQTKIADFLGAVDKQLDILNQKKEKLNLYKKGVMQQLFAQQIRFKDDNGNNYPDWEEKTLGEVLKYTQPNKFIVKSTDYNNNFNIPVLTAGKSFLLGFTNETDNIYKEIPCIIFDDFTTSSQFVDFEFKIKSSAMKILNTIGNDNIKFLFELINTIHFPTGDEHKRYWISEYSKLKLSIPSIEEQTKIAEFLSAIDKQIEAVENQITKTETYKKGLLQQMFV